MPCSAALMVSGAPPGLPLMSCSAAASASASTAATAAALLPPQQQQQQLCTLTATLFLCASMVGQLLQLLIASPPSCSLPLPLPCALCLERERLSFLLFHRELETKNIEVPTLLTVQQQPTRRRRRRREAEER